MNRTQMCQKKEVMTKHVNAFHIYWSKDFRRIPFFSLILFLYFDSENSGIVRYQHFNDVVCYDLYKFLVDFTFAEKFEKGKYFFCWSVWMLNFGCNDWKKQVWITWIDGGWRQGYYIKITQSNSLKRKSLLLKIFIWFHLELSSLAWHKCLSYSTFEWNFHGNCVIKTIWKPSNQIDPRIDI